MKLKLPLELFCHFFCRRHCLKLLLVLLPPLLVVRWLKTFSFSCAQGFSGCNTQKDIVEKRKVEYKDFTNKKVDSFWNKFDRDPQHAIKAIVRSGGSGAF